MDTAERIFKLLDDKNMEQKKFAEAIGTTDKVVSKWRTSGLKSYRKYLPQIAEVLETTVDFLLNGESDFVITVQDVPQQETIDKLLDESEAKAQYMIQSIRDQIDISPTLPSRLDPSICRLFLLAKIYATDIPPNKTLVIYPNTDELSDDELKTALAYRAASEDDRAVVDAALRKYKSTITKE